MAPGSSCTIWLSLLAIVMSHVVAIHQVDIPFLAAAHDQMGMSRAARGVGQQQRPARAEIRVVRRQAA